MFRLKNVLKFDNTFTRIEFWAANTIFAFILFFFIVDGLNGSASQENISFKFYFDQAGVPFDFYNNYFFPQLIRNISLFLALMLLNFIFIPALMRKHRVILNVFLTILTFIILGAIFSFTDMHLRGYLYGMQQQTDTTSLIFQQGFEDAFSVFAVFSAYTLIKYLSVFLIDISSVIESKYPFFKREGTVASIIWVIVLLFLLIGEIPGLLIAGWVIVIPSAILLYEAGFYILIPTSVNKKHPFLSYAFKNALILFIVLIAWGLILKLVVSGILKGDPAPLASLWIFNSVLRMFITVPLTWMLYKRNLKGNEEINFLKKVLGQSTASFDFLRSQINPHFLFNALNTIYGTALQEGAERTSEAVQKLGDMMRFMLQENMQEKISLAREIEYLKNYISLQKLRTDPDPVIQIHTELQEPETITMFRIAPMLLIPFVENAFKHGISIRESSIIRISLKIKENSLYFDIYNTKHIKQETDPEKYKSGIGLENVKQRLNLLYPKKHDLVIRETDHESFVHLTIQLK